MAVDRRTLHEVGLALPGMSHVWRSLPQGLSEGWEEAEQSLGAFVYLGTLGVPNSSLTLALESELAGCSQRQRSESVGRRDEQTDVKQLSSSGVP